MTKEERYGNYSEGGATSPPLGILYIAAMLETGGYTVAVTDGNIGTVSCDSILETAKQFQPDIIGISVTTIAYFRTTELVQELRRQHPRAFIVVGGPDISARLDIYRQAVGEGLFDGVVVGEGEQAMLELAQALEKGQPLEGILGLIYHHDGASYENPPRPFLDDLDSLPLPARHLLPDISIYRPHLFTFRRRPWTSMITSRGCPYQCIFCDRSVFGNRYRARSAQDIFNEIKLLYEKHNIREISIEDDTFTIDVARVDKLCDLLLEAKLDLIWGCCARANTLSRELIFKLKKAGCWIIHLGIESGNQEILKTIRKGITTNMVQQVVSWASEAGLMVRGFLMLGLPGETKASMRQTIEFAKSLDLYSVNFCITFLLPNTQLTKMAPAFGLVSEPNFNQMSGHSKERSFVPYGITAEELTRAQRDAYVQFYLRPKVIWKLFFGGSIRDLRYLFPKMLYSITFFAKFCLRNYL